jgi:hypothetical protein
MRTAANAFCSGRANSLNRESRPCHRIHTSSRQRHWEGRTVKPAESPLFRRPRPCFQASRSTPCRPFRHPHQALRTDPSQQLRNRMAHGALRRNIRSSPHRTHPYFRRLLQGFSSPQGFCPSFRASVAFRCRCLQMAWIQTGWERTFRCQAYIIRSREPPFRPSTTRPTGGYGSIPDFIQCHRTARAPPDGH